MQWGRAARCPQTHGDRKAQAQRSTMSLSPAVEVQRQCCNASAPSRCRVLRTSSPVDFDIVPLFSPARSRLVCGCCARCVANVCLQACGDLSHGRGMCRSRLSGARQLISAATTNKAGGTHSRRACLAAGCCQDVCAHHLGRTAESGCHPLEARRPPTLGNARDAGRQSPATLLTIGASVRIAHRPSPLTAAARKAASFLTREIAVGTRGQTTMQRDTL